MYWNKDTKTVSLSPADLQVMRQCGMSFSEIPQGSPDGSRIPPLWTLLSYHLLYNGLSSPGSARIWRQYRRGSLLAKERDLHYRPAALPKKDGSARPLHVPDREIAQHQRFILRSILECIPVSSCAFAYRQGVSAADCARPHLRQETLIHLDLRNFFGSITEDTVFRCLLRDTGYSRQLVGFLARICCYRGRLPQGACTSPVLSNICFRACDDALQTYAESCGLVYTRYSDDIYLSGHITDAGAVIRTAESILRQHGFTLNREKTRVLPRNTQQRVLGITVNDKLQVSRAYRDALRQELHYLRRYGADARAAAAAPDFLHYLYQLQGRISYVLSVDPDSASFQQAKEYVCSLIGAAEEDAYHSWLAQDNYGTFRDWKWYSFHPASYPAPEEYAH